MTGQTPSVGRVVHYVSRGSADGVYPPVCRAAIITQVPTMIEDGYGASDPNDDQTVGLCTLNPTGMFFDPLVAHDEGGEPGSWHWPERVE
jgi:hypothetical protein